MKKVRTWGSMLLALAVLVGACACLPLVSDWALANEEGKVVEHPTAQASFVDHTDEQETELPPRALTAEERVFVEKAREKFISLLEDDPAQPGYAAIVTDWSTEDGKWITVDWQPSDFEQRLLDPVAEPFLSYVYTERNDLLSVMGIYLNDGETYVSSSSSTAEGRAVHKYMMAEDEGDKVTLTMEEQALVDAFFAKRDALEKRFEEAQPRMRQQADAMLTKLGYAGAEYQGDGPADGAYGKMNMFNYQIDEDTQLGITVSLDLDKVCRIDIDRNVGREPLPEPPEGYGQYELTFSRALTAEEQRMWDALEKEMQAGERLYYADPKAEVFYTERARAMAMPESEDGTEPDPEWDASQQFRIGDGAPGTILLDVGTVTLYIGEETLTRETALPLMRQVIAYGDNAPEIKICYDQIYMEYQRKNMVYDRLLNEWVVP